MSTPSLLGDGASADIALQLIEPNTPAEAGARGASPNLSHSRTSIAGSDTESFETALSDTDRKFIRFLKSRMRAMRMRHYWKKFKDLFPESLIGKLTFFFAAWGVCFTVYEFVHLDQPTLANSREQTVVAQGAEAASQWNTYYQWVTIVCPAEKARGHSTPECEKAMNDTVPTPPKPQYHEAASLSHKFARGLAHYVNASNAFEQELLSSKSYCSPDKTLDAQPWPLTCSSINISQALNRRSYSTESLHILDRFPLPSQQNLGWLHHRPPFATDIPYTTYAFAVNVGYFFIISLAVAMIVRKWGQQYSLERRFYWTYDWTRACFCASSGLLIILIAWMKHLTMFLAEDKFLERCMAYKTSRTEVPPSCHWVFSLSSTLSDEEEIKVWSIWRGYLFSRVNEYSTDDFVALSIVLAFLLAVYSLCRRLLAIWRPERQEWTERRDEEGYFSIPSRGKATVHDEKI